MGCTLLAFRFILLCESAVMGNVLSNCLGKNRLAAPCQKGFTVTSLIEYLVSRVQCLDEIRHGTTVL
jgi:hypothetical protein